MESTEPRAAIELAADSLEKQLRRLKERRVSRKRALRSVNGRALPAEPESESGDEGEPAAGED